MTSVEARLSSDSDVRRDSGASAASEHPAQALRLSERSAAMAPTAASASPRSTHLQPCRSSLRKTVL